MCLCSLPPNSSYFHCRSCCATFTSITLFDEHRKDGECYNLEGVYEEDGVFSTEEGHARRRALSDRLRKAREAKP